MLNAGRSANASAFVAHTRFATSLFHHAWHACACVACVCVRAMRVRAWPRACGGTSRLAADKFRFPMLLTSAHMIFGSVVLLPVMLLTDGYRGTHLANWRKEWKALLFICAVNGPQIALNNASLVSIELSLNQVPPLRPGGSGRWAVRSGAAWERSGRGVEERGGAWAREHTHRARRWGGSVGGRRHVAMRCQ